MSTATGERSKIAAEWHARASDLAKWTMDRLVVRVDRHGGYGPNGPVTRDNLTDEIVQRHYKATQRGHVIGLHSTAVDGGACYCRWVALDWDVHGEADDRDGNLSHALAVYQKASALGFDPLLYGSNGKGGLHMRVLFSERVRSEFAYRFAQWLAAGHADHGIKSLEFFPKQPTILGRGEECGNWLRLPGRYHKRDWWSEVWNYERGEWMEGSEAIAKILATTPSRPGLIPEAIANPTPGADPWSLRVVIPPSDHEKAAEWLRNLPAWMCDDYSQWIKVGMSLSELGDLGLALWEEWSKGSTKHQQGECSKKWATFSGGGSIGLGSLCYWAEQNGWKRAGPSSNGSAKNHEGNGHADGKAGFQQSSGTMEEGERKGRPTQSASLLALAALVEVFHTPDGTAWGSVPVRRHRETHRIRSSHFASWLKGRFWTEHKSACNGDAIEQALSVLESRALFEGPEHAVYLRVASMETPETSSTPTLYLDLGDTEWRAVEITADGWTVVENPPVRFRRVKNSRALPIPERGGSLDDLRQFVNVPDESWPVYLGWLTQCLLPRGPFPVMIFSGEQGSAKSTTCELGKKLVDPSEGKGLRSAPRDTDDLWVAAVNAHVIAIDNISRLSDWLSDDFCRLSTGGGMTKRGLYTDSEEVSLDAIRPIVLNGISDFATRGDLLDRAILISCPAIPEESRREASRVEADFEQSKRYLLGALIEAVVGGLRERPGVKLDRLPRMADFCRWGEAVCRGLGMEAGAFLAAYASNRENAAATSLEECRVAQAVISLMADLEQWSGTASVLLERLQEMVPEKDRGKTWPKSPRSLADRLRRVAPALRSVGVILESERSGKDRRRILRLTCSPSKGGNPASASSATAADDEKPHENRGSQADAEPESASSAFVRPDSPASAAADDRRTQEARRTQADAEVSSASSALNSNDDKGDTSRRTQADAEIPLPLGEDCSQCFDYPCRCGARPA